MGQDGYFIGQRVPVEPRREILGRPLAEPIWHALITMSQAETKAEAWLQERDVSSWFPVEVRYRSIPGVPGKRAPFNVPIAPRYLFARFNNAPLWHEIKECRFITGVVGVSDRPMAITERDMLDMKQVPETLEAIKLAELDAQTISVGDRAEILDGPFEGFVVDISALRGGIAHFLIPLLGNAEATVPVDRLEKRKG